MSGMVDTFNLPNAATVLGRLLKLSRSNADKIQDVLSPRVIRFGIRVMF